MIHYKKELIEYFSKDSVIRAYLFGSTQYFKMEYTEIITFAGFRNRLVHMHSKIDIYKPHYYLQDNIGDIERFGKYIAHL